MTWRVESQTLNHLEDFLFAKTPIIPMNLFTDLCLGDDYALLALVIIPINIVSIRITSMLLNTSNIRTVVYPTFFSLQK